MHCTNCQKETNNPKFCSRSCAASYNNIVHPKRKVTRKCSMCDSPAKSSRSNMCEAHHKWWKDQRCKDKTIGEYRNMLSVRGKHPSWIHSHVRALARSWLKDLTTLPCAHCGYDKHVELAHIQPVASFPDTALLSEVNSKDNVVQLCRNCHWEFDHPQF